MFGYISVDTVSFSLVFKPECTIVEVCALNAGSLRSLYRLEVIDIRVPCPRDSQIIEDRNNMNMC